MEEQSDVLDEVAALRLAPSHLPKIPEASAVVPRYPEEADHLEAECRSDVLGAEE